MIPMPINVFTCKYKNSNSNIKNNNNNNMKKQKLTEEHHKNFVRPLHEPNCENLNQYWKNDQFL